MYFPHQETRSMAVCIRQWVFTLLSQPKIKSFTKVGVFFRHLSAKNITKSPHRLVCCFSDKTCQNKNRSVGAKLDPSKIRCLKGREAIEKLRMRNTVTVAFFVLFFEMPNLAVDKSVMCVSRVCVMCAHKSLRNERKYLNNCLAKGCLVSSTKSWEKRSFSADEHVFSVLWFVSHFLRQKNFLDQVPPRTIV